MKTTKLILIGAIVTATFSSCVTKKKFADMESKWKNVDESLMKCSDDLSVSNDQNDRLKSQLAMSQNEMKSSIKVKDDQMMDLRAQVGDLQKARDQQMTQVGDLTVLSKIANDNIDKTLSQMAEKDRYINLLRAARTKTDSINLALAVNLKQSIGMDLNDMDIDIKVDKTVVMINLSDAMLYNSGSYSLTSRANEVLGKIAKVINSRPDLEVMVEGYTDNTPIKTSMFQDNWDLSVKRSTSVVRALQEQFGINPNRLIAAGRGEYNAMMPNTSAQNKSMNRRTRIILMPKLDQFYNLLNPDMAKK
ncbi:MAG: chemotaxis protein MotB [Spirosomataceae bacterium]|jgi:chemotaxis protein MotB